MIEVIREKLGSIIVWCIVALIAFVFIFTGLMPNSNQVTEQSIAGEVNGEPVSLSEFNREYTRRIEFFKGMFGGDMKEEQIKAFKVREGVFQEIVNRKLMVQEAERTGQLPSTAQIRDEIMKIDAFKKDGNFDKIRYRQLLEANGYTAASFEKMVRDDLITQNWRDAFAQMARVSDLETKNDYLENGTKRTLRYVLITPEAGRGGVKVSDDEARKFLENPTKLNMAKARFEAEPSYTLQGKKFDDVKLEVAKELVAAEKTDEVRKETDRIADGIIGSLDASKASETKVNAMLKKYNLKLTDTEAMSKSSFFVPGFSGSSEAVSAVFAEQPSLKPMKFSSAAGTLVLLITKAETASLAKLDADELQKLKKQLSFRKQSEIYEQWMQKLNKSAKIKTNARLFAAEG